MLRAVAGALVKAVRRDLAGFASLQTNNFFLFVALLILGAVSSGVEPASSYPFLFALGVLMLFPASGDPLEKIPRVRLGLWPLTGAVWFVLRLLSLLLTPIFWLLAIFSRWLALIFTPLILAARTFVGQASASRRPRIPGPPLFVNNLRQLLTTLDAYLTLAIGAAGALYRLLAPHPDPEAFPMLALLAALALSTAAQSLFAFDAGPGLTRYRLLPIPAWRIILAKDAAYLAILLVAIAPLSIVPGLSSGLASLALGRYPAMHVDQPQQRWRFTSGRVFWGALQLVIGFALGFGRALAVAALLYAVSLWWSARQWPRTSAAAAS
jgi:hypothetical protein